MKQCVWLWKLGFSTFTSKKIAWFISPGSIKDLVMNNNKTLVANHFIFYYYFSHYTIYLFSLSLLYRMLKFSKLSHIKALDKNFELFYLTPLCNVLVIFSFIKLTSIIIFIYYIVFLSLCVILPLKLQDHLSVTTAASALFWRVIFLTKC